MSRENHRGQQIILLTIVVLATLAAPGAAQAQTLASLTLSPTSVVGGSNSIGTVTLSGPAGGGGATVFLSSSNPGVASVPVNVQIAAGGTTQTFAVTTRSVTTRQTATIGANLSGFTRSAVLTINPTGPPPSLSTLTLAPTTIVGGNDATGRVTIAGPAPPGGALVTLSSSNTNVAAVPGTVTVPEGATSATFFIGTNPVTTRATVTIGATVGSVTRTAMLTVTAQVVSSGPIPSGLAVFRRSVGQWQLRSPTGTVTTITFGSAGDLPVRADFLATGTPQLAVFRASTGEWLIRTETGGILRALFGGPGDLPVPADYFGLGRAQIAVFRPATAEWLLRQDNGAAVRLQFGDPGDVPVPADYFGLRRASIAVYRPSTGQWFVRTDLGDSVFAQWGDLGDLPVPADYFALGRVSFAVFRPSTGEWFLRNDQSQAVRIVFGRNGDIPLPSDFRNLGRGQLGIFRPSTAEWLVRLDDGNATRVQFGTSNDLPVVPSAAAMMNVILR
jgi:hypothetical protein